MSAMITTRATDAVAGTEATLVRRRSGLAVVRRLAVRTLGAALALWALVTITFVALYSMGNPVLQMVGDSPTQQSIDALTAAYGYDRSFSAQYVGFLGDVLRGRLGESIQQGRPALSLVLERLPATALLAGAGMLGGIVLGGVAGHVAALGDPRRGARVPLGVLTAVQAFPAFFKGIVLVLVFAVVLGWFPTGGFTTWGGLVLPASTLALAVAPGIGRVYRSALVGAAQQPHVLTAVATGMSARRVRRTHVQGNALPPVVTVVGLQLATLLGGALVVEQVFSWPGVGQLAFRAIQGQDYPVVLASTFVLGVGFLVINVLTDLVTTLIDPRTRSML